MIYTAMILAVLLLLLTRCRAAAPRVHSLAEKTFFAAEFGSSHTLAMLLKQGAALDMRNAHGQTLLHVACRSGNVATATVLLEKIQSLLMSRALLLLSHYVCHFDLQECLLVNAKDMNGDTALRLARHNIVPLLVSNGALVKDCNAQPETVHSPPPSNAAAGDEHALKLRKAHPSVRSVLQGDVFLQILSFLFDISKYIFGHAEMRCHGILDLLRLPEKLAKATGHLAFSTQMPLDTELLQLIRLSQHTNDNFHYSFYPFCDRYPESIPSIQFVLEIVLPAPLSCSEMTKEQYIEGAMSHLAMNGKSKELSYLVEHTPCPLHFPAADMGDIVHCLAMTNPARALDLAKLYVSYDRHFLALFLAPLGTAVFHAAMTALTARLHRYDEYLWNMAWAAMGKLRSFSALFSKGNSQVFEQNMCLINHLESCDSRNHASALLARLLYAVRFENIAQLSELDTALSSTKLVESEKLSIVARLVVTAVSFESYRVLGHLQQTYEFGVDHPGCDHPLHSHLRLEHLSSYSRRDFLLDDPDWPLKAARVYKTVTGKELVIEKC